jgi:hypothetical protein
MRNNEFGSTTEGPAIWTGGGVTHTKQAPTLYVRNIPKQTTINQVKMIFATDTGFIGARNVGQLLFIDFDSIKSATNAMRKHQGWKPDNVFKSHRGIVIDYDKDLRSKRNRVYERSKFKEMHEGENNREISDDYYCKICGNACLRLPSSNKLNSFKQRSTDNSFAIPDSGSDMIKQKDMVDGAVKLVRRKKGMEKQNRLNCSRCDVWIAYRCSIPSRFMYVLKDALTANASEIKAPKNMRVTSDKINNSNNSVISGIISNTAVKKIDNVY